MGDEAKKPTVDEPTIMDMDPFAFAVEERLSTQSGCVADAVTKIVRQATCNESASLRALHLNAQKLEASKEAFVELRNSRDARERALQDQIERLQADLHQAQLETLIVQEHEEEQQAASQRAKKTAKKSPEMADASTQTRQAVVVDTAHMATQTPAPPPEQQQEAAPCTRCDKMQQTLNRTQGHLALSQCDYRSACVSRERARQEAKNLHCALASINERAKRLDIQCQELQRRCQEAEARVTAHHMDAEEQSHVLRQQVLPAILAEAQASFPTGLHLAVMAALHLAAGNQPFRVEEYGSRGRMLRSRTATACSDLDLCIVFEHNPGAPPLCPGQFLRAVADHLPAAGVKAVLLEQHPGNPCPTLKVTPTAIRNGVTVDLTVDFPGHPRGGDESKEASSAVCNAVAFWKALLEHNGLDTIPRGSVRTRVLWHACLAALHGGQQQQLSEVMICTGRALLNVEELVGTAQLVVRAAVRLLGEGANPRVLCLTPLLRSLSIPGLS